MKNVLKQIYEQLLRRLRRMNPIGEQIKTGIKVRHELVQKSSRRVMPTAELIQKILHDINEVLSTSKKGEEKNQYNMMSHQNIFL